MTKKKKKEIKETPQRFKAFQLYCDLMEKNEDNVLDKVADEFNKDKQTIYNWSSSLKWKEREEKLRAEARERALTRLINKKEKQDLRVLDKLIDNLKRAEDNIIGSLDGEYSVSDYEKLVKLYRLLTDESTENSNSKVDYNLSDSDKETLISLSKQKSEDIMNVELDLGNEDD